MNCRVHRRLPVVLASVVVALNAPLRAQQVTVPGRPVGAVRGTVFDSLSRSALRQARVWIEGTMLSTWTDARGRYEFDSVPEGSRRILFEHPALDSIGLPQFGRRVMVSGGGAETLTDLAVPSLATIYVSLCGGPPPRPLPDADPPGVIFGSVSEAESDARLAGARVEVSWIQLRFEGGHILDLGRSAVNVRTDSLGNYYACNVPTERMVTVAGATQSSATGRLDVLVGDRRVARQDLRIAIDPAEMTLDDAGRLTGHAVVMGVVRGTAGMPLVAAQALVDDAGEPAATDPAGRFLLANLPAGSHMLMVRAIGYGAWRVPVHLAPRDTIRVSPELQALTVLDTLTVVAPRSDVLSETVQRLRAGGWGHALVGDQVRRAAMMSTVLQQLPSILIRDNRRDLRIIGHTAGRECDAHIWIDGYRSDPEVLRSLQPRAVVAVEWYPRGSLVPLRYAPPALDHCGVLLVWTDALR